MLDMEIETKNWMKKNGVEFTNERHISLTNLLIRVENDAYNDGLRMPKW